MRIFSLPFPEFLPILKTFIPATRKRGGTEGEGEGDCEDDEQPSRDDIEGSAVNLHVGKCIWVLHCLAHQPSIDDLREALGETHVFGHKDVISFHKPMQKFTNSTQFKLLLKQCHEAIATYELDAAADAKAEGLKDLVNEMKCTIDQVVKDPSRHTAQCAFIALED